MFSVASHICHILYNLGLIKIATSSSDINVTFMYDIFNSEIESLKLTSTYINNYLQRGSSKSAHAWISIIFSMLNTYVITTTKMKLFHSSKAARPQGCTLMYTLFVLIYDLLNISLKSLTILTATFFE